MGRFKLCIASILATCMGFSQVPGAGFTSLHVFGDSLSTTADSPIPSDDYYGGRYCNGRIWIEVLADWQDLSLSNTSSFGFDIENVETELDTYSAPADVGTALYILWVSGADFANFMLAGSGVPYDASNITAWNNLVTVTLDTHEAVITTLYNKGVRNLILPNQPDISAAPAFVLDSSESGFVKARVQEFNSGLESRLATLLPTLPGLKVWRPDVFGLLEDILANPTAYGLQNPATPPPAFDFALEVAAIPPDFAAGAGVDYVFWNDLNPTAAVQFILAELVQEEVCPPKIDSITPVTGGFELQFSNMQIGRAGSIEGSENLIGWNEDAAITPSTTSGTETLNPSGPKRFFRLNFNSGWIWP